MFEQPMHRYSVHCYKQAHRCLLFMVRRCCSAGDCNNVKRPQIAL